ncbi:MAG: hypothetical protein WCF65_00045 [Parachlamydiaceae bacterium]
MVCTLVSLIFAALLWLGSYHYDAEVGGIVIKTLMITSSFFFLFFIPLGMMFAWLPLQKAEQNQTPRILEMFRKDGKIRLESIWLSVFALTSLISVTDPFYGYVTNFHWFFPLWIILFGSAIDCLHHFVLRVLNYLNPFSVITMFSAQAEKCIQNDKELDFCGWIDSLSEVAIKGIQRHSTSVANLVLDEEQKLARLFLGASKSIAHETQDAQTKAAGIVDKVSFTMFYLYQRLDIVFEKALKAKLEPTCSLVVTSLGKISVAAAQYDMSLASAPIRFLGKCAKKAQDEGLEETALTASCVFSEIAKEILTQVDITYYEIKDPFLSIINGMEVLAKESFRRNKDMNIGLLAQPFKQLRELFKGDKVKNHQDTPIIVQNIDRVLGEFEALLIVMNTIPTIPKVNDTIGK